MPGHATKPNVGDSFVQNVDALDIWAPMHLAAGVILAMAGVPFWASALGASVFEVVEYPWIIREPQAESPRNVALDIGLVIGGWMIGNALKGTKK